MIRVTIHADEDTASAVSRHLGVPAPTTADLLRLVSEMLLTQVSLRADEPVMLADCCTYDVEVKIGP